MVAITVTVSAILAIIFGIVILVWPKSLSYVVATWLLIHGVLQLLADVI